MDAADDHSHDSSVGVGKQRLLSAPKASTSRLLQLVDEFKPYALNANAQQVTWDKIDDALWGRQTARFFAKERFFSLVDRFELGEGIAELSNTDLTRLEKLTADAQNCERWRPGSRSLRQAETEGTEDAEPSPRESAPERCEGNDTDEADEQSEELATRSRAHEEKDDEGTYHAPSRQKSCVDRRYDGLLVDLVVLHKPHMTWKVEKRRKRWARISAELRNSEWPRKCGEQTLQHRFGFLRRVLNNPLHSQHSKIKGSLKKKLAKYCALLHNRSGELKEDNEEKKPKFFKPTMDLETASSPTWVEAVSAQQARMQADTRRIHENQMLMLQIQARIVQNHHASLALFNRLHRFA